MVLRAAKVKNFQCHESLSVEFDPLVTVFVGPSDSGKSAILRALRWLATDRPLGNEYIRSGADDCSVLLRLDSGTIGKRTGAKREYKLGGQVFRAWGSSGPPEPIQNELNLSPINWQSQHDSPFWFSLTPGEVAKQLNEIVDLDVIDRVQAALVTYARKHRAAREAVECRLESVKRNAIQLDRVPALAAYFNQLRQQQDDLFTSQGKLAALCRAIKTLRSVSAEAIARKQAIAAGSAAIKLGHAAIKLWHRLDSLVELIRSAKLLQTTIKRKLPKLDPLNKKLESVQQKSLRLSELRACITMYTQAREQARTAAVKLQELKDLIQRECKGVCPVCGKPM